MKNWKSLNLLFVLLTISCFMTSCGEDREAVENGEYVVAVEIVSPANNATLTAGETFKVEVDYARNEDIVHNVKVEIMNEDGNVVKSLVNKHAHVANEFTFIDEAVTIDQTGTYIVRASTTDLDATGEHSDGHDGNDSDKDLNVKEHTIRVQ